MKIMNINLHFHPQSIGGATVVAEKLAWGLTQAGHEVTNVYLSLPQCNVDFQAMETPFGQSIGINNIPQVSANRFINPAVTSMLFEFYNLIQPDRIFIHAVQHMGIQAFLEDPKICARACIIAHDFYWVCLQGFRQLPDGSNCELHPNNRNCLQCAWYPGSTDNTYAKSHSILKNCRAVIFPSSYLCDQYVDLIGEKPSNFVVQSNPDIAEMIISDEILLPKVPGSKAKETGKSVFGFVGGPGDTKGWLLVREFMRRAEEMYESKEGPHVVLFDLGRAGKTPWYKEAEIGGPGISIADPFHWSFAAHSLSMLDVLLMPSRVRESFGLAAREALSLGKSCIIRPSGALAELQGCRGVVTALENDDVDSLTAKLAPAKTVERSPWKVTSISHYVDKLLSL